MISSRTYAGSRPLRCDDPQGQRIEMIAAGHTGVNASSRRVITGGAVMNTYRSPRKNHLAAKYIAISAITAAPAIQHHIGNSFAFSPRSSRSTQRGCHGKRDHRAHRFHTVLLHHDFHALTAPTVVATNSVVPHSRANAGHRGLSLDQL